MTNRSFITAVAIAILSLLTACGGGDVNDDDQAQSLADSNGAASQGIGGIGGSGTSGGATSQGIGGIGGSGTAGGATSQGVGGIGGSGTASH